NGVTWTFDYDAGTLTIGGEGAMKNYSYSVTAGSAAPWACTMRNVREFVTKIVIGKDVTSIGQYAFYGMENATEIVFEEGSALTTIATGAIGYTGIKNIVFPASLTTIEANGVYFNAALESISFEEGTALTTIGNYAFRDCTALTSATLPASLTSIGAKIFYKSPSVVVTAPAGSVAANYAVNNGYALAE
ncbi:MAG: leucine-rich repeat domain-containing protein, partial [Ruminococcaceae bacterium]|nr:leucine-rich repeat domain-containing protein [Oscillospiraceae bacterium]